MECGERIALSPRAIEPEHQERPRLLAQRMLGDEGLQPRDRNAMLPDREQGLGIRLLCPKPEIFEARDGRPHAFVVREIGQRIASPELEGLCEQGGARPGVRFLPGFGQRVDEAEYIHLGRDGHEHVPRRPGLDATRAQQLLEARDVGEQGVSRRLRWLGAPDPIDQPVGGNDAVRLEKQVGEHQPLPRPAEWELPAVIEHLEWAEDAELHVRMLLDASAADDGRCKRFATAVHAPCKTAGRPSRWRRMGRRAIRKEDVMGSRFVGRSGRAARFGSMAAGALLALVVAGTALAGLVSGALPSGAFTFTSTAINDVNIGGDAIHLKTKGAINVKTTYTRLQPTGALTGWHYHNGPVIVTVAVGTLTYVDASCHEWDLRAGESYIESTGEILNAYLDPTKNSGLDAVEWFSTRLYPADANDPVSVAAPCSR